MSKPPKRPRDPNQLAKFIVDVATGEGMAIAPEEDKDPKAVARGRAGGVLGGRVRAMQMTKEERAEAARLAAQARWKRKES